jgi:hypothetical protein
MGKNLDSHFFYSITLLAASSGSSIPKTGIQSHRIDNNVGDSFVF